jgi:hypothetical protein
MTVYEAQIGSKKLKQVSNIKNRYILGGDRDEGDTSNASKSFLIDQVASGNCLICFLNCLRFLGP